ncbi:ORF111 [White spot syndrome virus]|uniref:ORF111 n=1 Tax=White spot syndrome virus TaxID=342409 RepID=A0A2D3I5U0_9VIRU|nr:ORF111 [White spot syndrome virus]
MRKCLTHQTLDEGLTVLPGHSWGYDPNETIANPTHRRQYPLCTRMREMMFRTIFHFRELHWSNQNSWGLFRCQISYCGLLKKYRR